MPRRGREGGREGEISDIKKAPLLRRAALKMSASTECYYYQITGLGEKEICI